MRQLLPLLAIVAAPVFAGQFSVSPIRVDLNNAQKSEAITVANTGDTPLRISVELKRWTQDATGADHYQAGNELVYFPRQMEVPVGEKRIVRVGRKGAPKASEAAYRLYINEQPPEASSNAGGQVSMVVSFGVPVFVAPKTPDAQLQMHTPRVEKGNLILDLKNSGNSTVRLSRAVLGDEVIDNFPRWYLHPGIKQHYQLPLPQAACKLSGEVQLTLESTLKPQTTTITLPKNPCAQ